MAQPWEISQTKVPHGPADQIPKRAGDSRKPSPHRVFAFALVQGVIGCWPAVAGRCDGVVPQAPSTMMRCTR